MFSEGSLNARRALQILARALERSGRSAENVAVEGGDESLPWALARLDERKRSFRFIGDGVRMTFSVVGNACVELVEVVAADESGWDSWVAEFLDQAGFVMALVVDSEYDFWQNAEDVLEYEARGRTLAGQKMKSNGLPFPLERQVVDTSANPGRWCFRAGFLEGVGSTMWLGERFWSLSGATMASVQRAPGIKSRQLAGTLRIEVEPQPFLSDEGASAERQRMLRALLFPMPEGPLQA